MKKIVVIGAGEVGYHLARQLSKGRENNAVTLVDSDPMAIRRCAQSLDVQTVLGHGADDRVLVQAGVEDADLVAAVTNNDELNMLASLICKKLGTARTVVRLHARASLLSNHFFYKDTLGFDLTVSPEEMTALEVVRLCRGQNAMPVENFAGGKLQMRRLEIHEASPCEGKLLADISLPGRVLVTGIHRGQQVIVPRGQAQVRAGDTVVLMGVLGDLERAEKVLGGRSQMPRRVIVVGGGPMAKIIYRMLEPLHVDMRLIFDDEEEAKEIHSELPRAKVSFGRGTDADLLAEEGVEGADFFCAMSSSEETNVLACQLARTKGAKRTAALVMRKDYVQVLDALGVDHALRPRWMVARRIARYVRGVRTRIATLHHGLAEVLDQVVGPNGPFLGQTLREAALPPGSIVGGIIRQDEVIVPDGETRLMEGDHLIVIAQHDVVPEVDKLWEENDPGEEEG